MIEGADPEHVGVIFDVGNNVWEGYADPRLTIALLGPYLHHVHLKNVRAARSGDRWVHEWAPLAEGFLDVGDVLATLDRQRYSGWITIEDLSRDRTPTETLHFNATYLRGLADRVRPR
ncbi:sugar phosphate isomerase/epimerase family protein [Cryptosporangium sp. NPDC051539]|uniref:sugar phosphate isomerase/epimerase family protein n=1 Tax=Cryptosporangium sp. NPDC051539 TaxID=3363962 RepID=UPI0037BC44AE